MSNYIQLERACQLFNDFYSSHGTVTERNLGDEKTLSKMLSLASLLILQIGLSLLQPQWVSKLYKAL